MIKIIRENEICPECGRSFISTRESEYYCDECGEQFYPEGKYFLEMTAFFDGDKPTKDFHFCCWKCVLKFLKSKEDTICDAFIYLPNLTFGKEKQEGILDFLNSFDVK